MDVNSAVAEGSYADNDPRLSSEESMSEEDLENSSQSEWDDVSESDDSDEESEFVNFLSKLRDTTQIREILNKDGYNSAAMIVKDWEAIVAATHQTTCSRPASVCPIPLLNSMREMSFNLSSFQASPETADGASCSSALNAARQIAYWTSLFISMMDSSNSAHAISAPSTTCTSTSTITSVPSSQHPSNSAHAISAPSTTCTSTSTSTSVPSSQHPAVPSWSLPSYVTEPTSQDPSSSGIIAQPATSSLYSFTVAAVPQSSSVPSSINQSSSATILSPQHPPGSVVVPSCCIPPSSNQPSHALSSVNMPQFGIASSCNQPSPPFNQPVVQVSTQSNQPSHALSSSSCVTFSSLYQSSVLSPVLSSSSPEVSLFQSCQPPSSLPSIPSSLTGQCPSAQPVRQSPFLSSGRQLFPQHSPATDFNHFSPHQPSSVNLPRFGLASFYNRPSSPFYQPEVQVSTCMQSTLLSSLSTSSYPYTTMPASQAYVPSSQAPPSSSSLVIDPETLNMHAKYGLPGQSVVEWLHLLNIPRNVESLEQVKEIWELGSPICPPLKDWTVLMRNYKSCKGKNTSIYSQRKFIYTLFKQHGFDVNSLC